MRASRLLAGSVTVAIVAFPAAAAERHSFAIPGGPLDRVLIEAANQGRANVGFSDPALGRLTSRGLTGSMTMAAALDRLLADTGFAAIEIRSRTFRIDPRKPGRAPPIAHEAPSAVAEVPEIVVTSSKRDVPLTRLAGSAVVISMSDRAGLSGRTGQLSDLGNRLPVIQSTALGPGRDKLFLRGIADSSFAGPTQSTIGSYFGDTRLLYNGPDPDLRLYDVDRVELLMGPQGTLYGAGAIGGIVRIAPKLPVLGMIGATLQAGVSATGGGGIGHELAGALNLPAGDRLAFRAVGYQLFDAGYIDDPSRGRRNVNGVAVIGGRLAARAEIAPAWTADLGLIVQSTDAHDLQYATRDAHGYARGSAFAQPFEDDFRSGYGTIRHDGAGGINALITFGITDRRTDGRYDATVRRGAPIAYDQTGHDRLYSGEARIWQTLPSGANWILGVSAVINQDSENRSLGPLADPRDLIGVDNRTRDVALFGEGTLPLPLHAIATLGGRLTHARTDGRPLDTPGPPTFFRGTSSTRFDPSFGFVLPVVRGISWFGRYGVGFRTGGLAVAARVGRTAVYQSDRIEVVESGLRFGHEERIGFSGHAAFSYARWKNIQADLVATNGFPFTANVGDGRIGGFEAVADWRPSPSLQIGGAAFANRSRLIHPAPAFVRAQGDPLPDTPRFSGNLHAIWRPLGGGAGEGPEISLLSHYVGRSRLGVGPRLSIPQGRYNQLDGGISMPLRRFVVSLDVDNIADHRGNRFAVGNPLSLGREQQFTPLRPRTFRLRLSTDIGGKAR